MSGIGTAVAIGGSALASLAGGFATNAANSNLNYRNRKWQEEMWNKQNEYNSPSAVLARYADAGIQVNPNYLVTGNYDGGLASHVGSPEQFAMKNPMEGVDLSRAITESQRLENETMVAESQKEKNEAEAYEATASGNAISQENEVRPQQLQLELNKLGYDVHIRSLEDFVKEQTYNNEIKLIYETAEKAMYDKEVTIEEKKVVAQQFVNLVEEYNNLIKTGKYIEAQTLLENAKVGTELSQQSLNKEMESYYNALKTKVPAEVADLRASARQKISSALLNHSQIQLNKQQADKIANEVDELLYNGNTKRALDVLHPYGTGVAGIIRSDLYNAFHEIKDIHRGGYKGVRATQRRKVRSKYFK